MINFYKDANLLVPVTHQTPAYFFLSENGGQKVASTYVGLVSQRVASAAAAGASSVELDSTENLPPSGSFYCADHLITYATKTGNVLGGIPASGAGALRKDLAVGARVFPQLEVSDGNLEVVVTDLAPLNDPEFPQIWLKRIEDDDSAYLLPGTPLLFSTTSLNPHRNLLLGYRFNNPSGAVDDYSSNDRAGTTVGPVASNTAGVQVASGSFTLFGSKVTADGISDTDGADLESTGSVELWIKTEGFGTLFEINSRLLVDITPQKKAQVILTDGASGGASVVGVDNVADGWMYLVATWDATDLRLYLNGKLVGTDETAFTADLAGRAITIGGIPSDVCVDEVRLYSRVLDYNEVSVRYANGKGVGLVDYALPSAGFDVKVVHKAGTPKTWSWSFTTNVFTVTETGETGLAGWGSARGVRDAIGLRNTLRLYPEERVLTNSSPGFLFGQHRWRSSEEINAHALIPTAWDVNPVSLGVEKFIAGIGDREDLEVARIEKPAEFPNSIFARIRSGHYFTGHDRYYFPAKPRLEIVRAGQAGQTFVLGAQPAAQKPIFLGTYRLDYQGFYDSGIEYRCVGKRFSAAAEVDPDDFGYQFTLSRATKTLKINKAIGSTPLYLGVVSDAPLNMIDVPVYPIWSITRMYAAGPEENIPEVADVSDLDAPCFQFNREEGLIVAKFPESYSGRSLHIEYVPALAVFYDVEESSGNAVTKDTYLLGQADLNPAFSGIAQGYLYVQHRRQRSRAIELFADKPRIPIPAVYQTLPGGVAFGPVYYNNDFALLMAVATGVSSAERVVGKRLRVAPLSGWQGYINYQDPSVSEVEVVTGGDGAASMIYAPPAAYGYYLKTSVSVSGSQITLPTPTAFDQLWSEADGWTVNTYMVFNNHPYLGKVGARPSLGEVPWVEFGTPGEISYRTNGKRELWLANKEPVLPINAKDANGEDALVSGALNPSFNGLAASLQYGSPVPTVGAVGSHFISFIGRVAVRVFDPETGVYSNYIVLQLDDPPIVEDEPGVAGFLRPNDNEVGRLNINRLGGGPIPPGAFFSRRY